MFSPQGKWLARWTTGNNVYRFIDGFIVEGFGVTLKYFNIVVIMINKINIPSYCVTAIVVPFNKRSMGNLRVR